MAGPVEKHLLNRIQEEGAIHLTLIDPEKVTPTSALQLAERAEEYKTTAIMVGGSTSVSTTHLDNIIKTMKHNITIPIILFPNNVSGISKYADAIWFMSLLNSTDPYFLVGAQILGAPIVKKSGLEALPLGYIIVGDGGTAGVVGHAVPIPYKKPELASAHALTAQYFGMRFVYLEAGSGARQPVPSVMISAVKEILEIPLIVGGGIRNAEQAKTAVISGADIIVTGNITEDKDASNEFKRVVTTVRKNT